MLRLLKEGALTTTELLVNMAMTPFQHSYKGSPAPLRGKKFSIRNTMAKIEEERDERVRFYNLLTRLRRDGLIKTDPVNKQWLISKKGRVELVKLDKEPEQRYPRRDSREVIVISYDIPEKYRRDRDWLRSILKLLEFRVLHQSVWIGKTEIPETLLTDLQERRIHTFIHMFTIGKRGSIIQIL